MMSPRLILGAMRPRPSVTQALSTPRPRPGAASEVSFHSAKSSGTRLPGLWISMASKPAAASSRVMVPGEKEIQVLGRNHQVPEATRGAGHATVDIAGAEGEVATRFQETDRLPKIGGRIGHVLDVVPHRDQVEPVGRHVDVEEVARCDVDTPTVRLRCRDWRELDALHRGRRIGRAREEVSGRAPDVDPPCQADAGEPTDRLDPMARVDQTGARGVPGKLAPHGEEIGTVERGQGGRVGDAIHILQAAGLAPHDGVPVLDKTQREIPGLLARMTRARGGRTWRHSGEGEERPDRCIV